MSKSNPMHRRVESYFYEEPGTKRGVFVLPKGTLAPEREALAGAELRRQAWLHHKVQPVIHSRGQNSQGYTTPPQNRMVTEGDAPRERGWNPHGARTLPVKAL